MQKKTIPIENPLLVSIIDQFKMLTEHPVNAITIGEKKLSISRNNLTNIENLTNNYFQENNSAYRFCAHWFNDAFGFILGKLDREYKDPATGTQVIVFAENELLSHNFPDFLFAGTIATTDKNLIFLRQKGLTVSVPTSPKMEELLNTPAHIFNPLAVKYKKLFLELPTTLNTPDTKNITDTSANFFINHELGHIKLHNALQNNKLWLTLGNNIGLSLIRAIDELYADLSAFADYLKSPVENYNWLQTKYINIFRQPLLTPDNMLMYKLSNFILLLILSDTLKQTPLTAGSCHKLKTTVSEILNYLNKSLYPNICLIESVLNKLPELTPELFFKINYAFLPILNKILVEKLNQPALVLSKSPEQLKEINKYIEESLLRNLLP